MIGMYFRFCKLSRFRTSPGVNESLIATFGFLEPALDANSTPLSLRAPSTSSSARRSASLQQDLRLIPIQIPKQWGISGEDNPGRGVRGPVPVLSRLQVE